MKKIFFLAALLNGLIHHAFAQHNKIDSLQSLLKTDKEDTNKVNHFNELGWELRNQNPDTSILLTNEALALCEELSSISKLKSKIQNLKASALGNLGVFYMMKSEDDRALDFFLKALKLDEGSNNKIGIATRLGNIGMIYDNQGDFPKALDYYSRALKIDEDLGNKTGIATNLTNIGTVYASQADFPRALENYFKALKIREEMPEQNGNADEMRKNKNNIPAILANIGTVYGNQANYPKALEYNFKALKMDEEIGNKIQITGWLTNIGVVYKTQRDYPKALDYYFRALKMAEELEDKNKTAALLGNIGNVYNEQMNFSKALDYYLKSLKIAEESGNKYFVSIILENIGFVYSSQGDYPKALNYYFKSLKMGEEMGDKNGIASNLSKIGLVYTKTGKFKEAEKYLKDAIAMNDSLGVSDQLRGGEELISQLYDTTAQVAVRSGQYAGAAENYRQSMLHYKKAMALKDTLFTQEKNNEITRNEMNYEYEKKEAAAKAEQDVIDAITGKELQKQKLVRNGFVGGFAVVLLFAGIFFTQRNKIKKGKKLSDELLLNILPSEVAEELKQKGTAEAKLFDDVTVIFTDVKNFTRISEKLSPADLVAEMNNCFKAFDNIIGKYNIEKIKTIGDSYMAAGGLPVPNKTNATDVVNAALEIQRFMEEQARKKLKEGKQVFEIRIGIHTGPVVAGIVGVKKFAYDIWGDTVNIASKMEKGGEAGKVNISRSTYELVKDKFNCIYRGKIEAKNKGMIDMYFVNNII